MPQPVRLLTAVPICDGHDSAINTINLEFIRRGIEVVYLGFHRSVSDVVRAAIQEDVRAIGISSYNGGHVEFFREVRRGLDRLGASHIGLFGGGGGTISQADLRTMLRQGTDRIFFPGETLDEMAQFVLGTYGKARKPAGEVDEEGRLAAALTRLESRLTPARQPSKRRARTVGITGPGGAGKTTLIDELVLRFLSSASQAGRVAILSHDPSIVGDGALLGDRATMVHSQNDRVFVRSMATRGQAGGLSPATEACLDHLSRQGFDLILVETVGTGQEALPFRAERFDLKVLVMNPDYGARLQLQKIAMIDSADVVVVNKADQPRAKAAAAELGRRLSENGRGQRLIVAEARKHGNAGVNELFVLVTGEGIGFRRQAKGLPHMKGLPQRTEGRA
jgi:methylmalonyl-CoA mutase